MYIIDRFEDGENETFAVLELLNAGNGKNKVVPRTALTADAKPGDVLNDDFSVNGEETDLRKRYVKSLTERIFNEK